MDNGTTQFVFRLFASVLAGAIASTLLFVFALAIIQGDGEAQQIASTFTPWLVTTLGALVAIFLGSHLVALKLGVTNPSVTIAPSTSTAPQAAPQPVTPATVAGAVAGAVVGAASGV